VALVVTDLDGVITYVSPALTRITGYESSEVIGKKTSILKSGQTPPSTYQDLWATIKRGEIWKGEWVNKKKNGDLYTENVTISPVYDEQGKMINYIAVKEDVTLNRQVEKDRIAKTVAEEAN
jgi:PAS domain S-box-containing protein